MSARGQREYEDDGRTIADMSGVSRRSFFGIAPRDQNAASAETPREPVKNSEPNALSGEERRWVLLGMMKAGLLVGLCFAVGIALVILAFLYL